MDLKLYYENLSAADDEIRTLMDRWAQQKLKPRLNNIATELEVALTNGSEPGKKYAVRLRLRLPHRHTLFACAEANDRAAATKEAQSKLLRQIDRHLDRLRRQSTFKRMARRERQRELKQQSVQIPDSVDKQAETDLEPLIPRLEQVVRRELAFLRNTGAITDGYPTVQDVVDEAVLTVKADWRSGESENALLQRLLRSAFKVLDAEITASRRYGESVSLEQAPSKDAEDQAEAMVQEEFYEFYQPDEALRLSDVLPDRAAVPPDSELEDAQTMYTLETLRDLPILWRRTLMLSEIEQLALEDIASILEVELEQIEKWIERANDFICAHLEQAGFSITTGQPLAGHGMPEK